MDNALSALLSWQFLLFCLAIAAITYVVRQVMEYLISNYTSFAKESKLWNDLILPLLPIFMGCFGALLAKMYPYPEGFHTASARVAFGLVAGLLSSVVYRMVKSFLIGKANTFMSPQVTNTPNITTNVTTTVEGDVGAARNDAANKG